MADVGKTVGNPPVNSVRSSMRAVPKQADSDEAAKLQAYGKLRSAMQGRVPDPDKSIAQLENQVNQLQEIGKYKYQIREWLVDLVCGQLKDPSGNFDVLSGVAVKSKDLKKLIKSDVTSEAYEKVIGNNDGKYDDAVPLGEFTKNIVKALEFESDVSDDPIQGLKDLLGSNKIILVDEKDKGNDFNTAFNTALSEHLHLQPKELQGKSLRELYELLEKNYPKSYLLGALVRVSGRNMSAGRNMSDNEVRSRAGMVTLCWFISHDRGVGKYAYKIYSRGDKKSYPSDGMAKVYGAAIEWGLGWDKEISPEKYLKGIKIEMKNVSDKGTGKSSAVPAPASQTPKAPTVQSPSKAS